MVHMVTIKLSLTNFLLWHNQVVPLLQCQKFYDYVDGLTLIPSTTTDPITNDLWKQMTNLL